MADTIVIGTLRALLKLDTAEFENDTRKASKSVDTMGKTIDGSLTKLTTGFGNAGKGTEAFSRHMDTAKIAVGSFVGSLASHALMGGISALVDMGKSAFDTAGKIVDLSNKTGLSTDAIQEMQFVADQTGGSLDQFTQSAFQLGVRLSGGSNSVKAAVEAVGLSFAKLQQQTPEEQFESVVGALGRMDDATKRNEIGVALFGKSFANIAAAVSDGYRQMANQATKSSEEQLKALDKTGDAWARFTTNTASMIRGGLGSALQFIEDQWEFLLPVVDENGRAIKFVGEETAKTTQSIRSAIPSLDEIEEAHKADEKAAKDAARAVEQLNAAYAATLSWAKNEQGMALFRFDEMELKRVELFRKELELVANLRFDRVTGDLGLMQAELQQLEQTMLGFEMGEAMVEALLPPPSRWKSAVDSSLGALPDLVFDVITNMGGFMSNATSRVLGSWEGQIKGALPGIFGSGDGKQGLFGSIMSSGLSALMGPAGPLSGLISAGITRLAGLALKGLGKMWDGIKGIFGTDEEASKVNPARDEFFKQFGGAGVGEGSGFLNLAKRLTEITGEAGGGSLFRALTGADTMEEFNRAVAAIVELLDQYKDATTSAPVEDGVEAIEDAGLTLSDLTGVTEETITKLHAAMIAMGDDMLKFAQTLRDQVVVAINETIAALNAIPRVIDISVRYGGGSPAFASPALAGDAGISGLMSMPAPSVPASAFSGGAAVTVTNENAGLVAAVQQLVNVNEMRRLQQSRDLVGLAAIRNGQGATFQAP